MSKTIDEKIVQMKFDNGQFEQGVSKSLKTLDTLKFRLQTMDFRKSATDLETFGTAANKIDMSGLSQGLETVHAKFSALQVIGVTALANLTNSAINAGKRISSALTDALVSGGRERAQKIKDAKFQMEGLLGTKEYKKQWDRIDQSINYAVADTAYGYDSAARAASQFLASNVKVGKEMDKSLRAISGIAAMTNSTYDDVSNIFTRIAGQGKVMAVDLNSLASRGMNAAAILGKSMHKSEAEIRDMVHDGKISFKDFAFAMDDAFGEHAKKGNETFQGALANMKAAMARIGAKVWDPLLDNQRDVFNQARLLINDLNNNYLNEPIKNLNNKLTDIFQGIVKFFKLGGVKNILLGIANVLSFISSVIKPVKDAFRDIFPKKSIENLVEYTKRFKDFTSKIKLSEETANNIKNTFKGLFSILSTGIHIIITLGKTIGQLLSNLTGIPGGILGVTGSIGKWITNLSEAIKKSNIFSNVMQGIVNVLEGVTNKFKEFTKHFNIFEGLVNGIKKIFTTIGLVLKEFGKVLGEALRSGDIKAALDVFNTGVFSGILINIKQITKTFDLFFRKVNKASVAGNLGLIISSIKNSLYALQFDIQADALIRIAKAILVLAGALFVLSLIKPDRLSAGLVGLGLAMTELMAAFKYLDTFTSQNFRHIGKLAGLVYVIRQLAISLAILSLALKVMSTIDIKQMGVALLGMGAGLSGFCIALHYINKNNTDMTKASKSIRKLATSLLVLSLALKIMGSMNIEHMGIALLGMVVGLTAMTIAINKLPTYKKGQDKIASMTKMAFSLILLALALKILASIGWPNILIGLGAMGGALAILLGFVYLLPKDIRQLNARVNALNMMALGLGFLGFILKDLGKMSWDQVKTSLTAMGGALTELLLFIRLMPKNFNAKGFVSLAFSVMILAGSMKLLSTLDIKGLLISLGALAGALIILGVAGKVLEPLIPALLGIAGAVALFGAGMLLFGAGVLVFATGLAALAAALTGGVTIIVAGIQAIILGVAQLIPELIKIFGESIVSLCKVIMTSAPMIAETLLVVIHETLQSLVDHGPEIVSLLFQFLIGILKQLKDYLPEFIVAGMEVIEAFLEGIVKGLKQIDPTKILPAVEAIGLLTGIFLALAALSNLIPQAMLGVLGFGILIAELGVVLAAIGGLSRIPGLKEIVSDGGNFLQIIGTAIGQFIGGIAGGIAKGFTSSLPEIGTNLSEFMNNLDPFISGCRLIDKSVFNGVTILYAAILEITSANLISKIAKFMTLGSSFAGLGKELSSFMNNAEDFIKGIKDLKPENIQAFSILTNSIIKLTTAKFIDSINKFMSFGSSFKSFSNDLKSFGEGLKSFSKSIEGIDPNAISLVVKAADGLVELSNKVPNRQGISNWFDGKKSLKLFGGELEAFADGLKEFADGVVNLNPENINNAINAAEKLIDLTNKVPNRQGMGNWFGGKKSLKLFGGELEAFADGLRSFSDKVIGLKVNDMYYASKAADLLIELTNKTPNRAGMSNWFSGKKSLKLFGGELKAFGDGLKDFADSVKDINIESMNKAIDGANKLAEITNILPNRAGMGNWFAGKKSIKTFGNELKAFGDGIKSLCDSVKDANIDNIGKVADGAKGLAEITNILPNRAGMGNWFSGKKSLKTFGNELKTFGKGVKDFADETKDIQIGNMKDVVEAVKILADATSVLPNIKGKELENRTWGFGSGIGHIANGLSWFCEKLKGNNVNIETVKMAASAVKTLSEVFNNLPDKDGGKIENRGWGLGQAMSHFADGINSFIGKIDTKSVDSNFISTIGNSIKIMAEVISSLPDMNGDKIQNRAWGLGSAIGHFANGFSYLMIKLNESNFDANKIISFSSSIKSMAEAIGVLPDVDGGKIENRSWGLGSAMGHFGNGLKSLNYSLNESNYDPDKVKSAAESVKIFSEAFNNLPDVDGGKIENRAWGLGSAMGHFGNGLKSLNYSLNESNYDPDKVKSAAESVKIFGETFNSLPDVDGGKIENRAWGLGSAIGHFGGGLKEFCSKIADSTFDKIKDAINYIKDLSSVSQNLPDNVGSKLAQFGSGISTLGDKLGIFITSIKEIDFSNIDSSFDSIKKLLKSIESLSNINLEDINKIGDSIKKISDGLINLSNVPSDIASKINSSLESLGKNGANSFIKEFNNIKSNMDTKGTEAISGFTSGIINNQNQAISALTTLHNKCKNEIKVYEYEKLGKNVVEGFAQGISNNQSLATTAMSIMTKKVEEQARSNLDINSPSKLFRKIGSGIPEGFAQGISMFKSSIIRSVSNMSSSAIDSTRNAISKISSIINDDIEDEITLRPILDLSNVESGANKIGSLFGSPSLALASNLGSISYGMNNRQNGGEEIVSAIDKLSKSLGNTSNNTYNINGITYDDGSNISSAVRDLIQAAKIERRT